jgi:hyperosmotically inducible protein
MNNGRGMVKSKFVVAGLVVGFAGVLGQGLECSPAREVTRQIPPRAHARLVREVGYELRMLPYYSVFDNLEYRVIGYSVVLTGQVTRPTLRSSAEAAVKRIEGVEKVTNRIEVLPVSFYDDRIRLAVYRAVYSHPVLTRYALQAVPPLHIIVKNGHVTLVGVLATDAERNVAFMEARTVPGIFSVTNKVRVERSPSRG